MMLVMASVNILYKAGFAGPQGFPPLFAVAKCEDSPSGGAKYPGTEDSSQHAKDDSCPTAILEFRTSNP